MDEIEAGERSGDADLSVDTLLDAVVGALPGGQRRDGQHVMANAVARAFETGEHLLVQAGTGTGKSVAYLVPALRHGETVVVSTATLALQRQLVDIDIPKIIDTLEPALGRRPEVALLKGRSNYLCRLRLADGETDIEPAELLDEAPASKLGADVTRLREWAERTDSGDRDDAPGVNDRAWRLVSVSARECVGATKCAFGDECFSERARERARKADIIVTNHSLLALDILSDGRVLPPHDAVVVDEAHELVAKTTDQAADEISTIGARIAARRGAPFATDDKATALDSAVGGLVGLLESIPPGRLAPVPGDLVDALRLTRTAAVDAAASVDDETPAAEQAKTLLLGLAATAERIADGKAGDVVWLDSDDRGRRALKVAPLDVAPQLLAGLFGTRTVVATSATLALGGEFGIVARQFGLPPRDSDDKPRWRGLDAGSPFDYARQGILYVASHLPEPTRAGTAPEAADELVALVEAAGGRTLGLFSSMRAAREATEVLRQRTSFPVLLQGEDALGALVRRFKADPRACLFGTLSLWQGVDVPGEACQLVVIDRIPFPRPDDPLYAARDEAARQAGLNGFMTVAVPHAALLLAQAAGRLIRRSSDRGVVAVLDPRLGTRRYANFLRKSLPGFWPTTDSEVARAALKRLDEAATPSATVAS